MSKHKHTPGPWISTDSRAVITDWPKVGFLTTVADCRIGGGTRDEQEANARLIAAAPDMYFFTKLVAAIPILDPNAPGSAPIFGVNGQYITVEDVRAARATLEKVER